MPNFFNKVEIAGGLTKTAFGDLITAELTPVVNVDFSYVLHPELVTTRLNNGAASIDANRMKLSTGAGANQSAQLFTNIPIKYYAGIGVVARFTALFTTGVAGSTQIIGIGDSGDFLGIGFDGADFGVFRRKGGGPEIRSLQVTTGSTTAENITITLNDDVDATVAVTNSGDATVTANEIAAHDFSNLGRGWKAVPNGDTVNFISYCAAPYSGTYSLSGATTAVGSFSQKLLGITPIVEDWVKQTAWSYDRFLEADDPDASPSGITLDPANGNVFQIVFGWLGFDAMAFYIKHPVTREYELVHVIEYANANLTPSVNIPTLPICAIVENTTNTTDMVLYSSSMGGFIQGKKPKATVKHVHIIDKTFTDATVVPAITLHNNGVFAGKINRVRMRLTGVSAVVDSGKPIALQIIRGATLVGASFSEHNVGESVALFDIAASALSGGETVKAFPVASGDDKDKILDLALEPTEFITIAGAQTASGTDSVTKIIIEWEEDF